MHNSDLLTVNATLQATLPNVFPIKNFEEKSDSWTGRRKIWNTLKKSKKIKISTTPLVFHTCYLSQEKRFRNPIFLFSDFCFHLSIAKAEIVHKGFFAKLLIKAHKRTHVTKHLSNKKGKKQQKLFVNPKNELKLFCVNNECIYSE